MNKNFLPIGSVCLLKEATKKVMITGFCVRGQGLEDKVFDYLGCVYPEGVISSDQNLLFNHDQIEKIYFTGFSNEEDKAFKIKINELLAKQELENIEMLDMNEDILENTSTNVNDMDVPVATIVSESSVNN